MRDKKRKKRREQLYQCDGFMAIEHRADKKLLVTVCEWRPTQAQWDAGTAAVEHEIESCMYQCQICLPVFKKEN